MIPRDLKVSKQVKICSFCIIIVHSNSIFHVNLLLYERYGFLLTNFNGLIVEKRKAKLIEEKKNSVPEVIIQILKSTEKIFFGCSFSEPFEPVDK